MTALVDVECQPRYELGSSKAWMVCFSAALFFFYEFIQMHMFNAINNELRVAFSANAKQLSFLSSTYLWADLLFLLPAGILLDRVSTRKIILLAMAICIVGTLGFAVSYSFGLAAFFHFLSGIGNAFCFLSCIMLVSRWFPAHRQALVIGLVVTMAFLGGMAAQTPLVWLSSHFGWRQALMLDTLLGLFIMVLIFSQVIDQPKGEFKRQENAIPFLAGLKSVLKNKQNWLPGIYTWLLNLPIMVLCALWGIVYLEKVHHLTSYQASEITSMIFIGSIIGAPLAGFISDSLRLRKLPMVTGIVATLVCFLVIMNGSHLSYNSLMVLFWCIGFFSSTQVIAYPMVAESNPAELTGTATGLASLLIMGGAAAGQLLFGHLLDYHWSGSVMEGAVRVYSAQNYQFAMKMFPVACIIGLIAILLARETYCHKQR